MSADYKAPDAVMVLRADAPREQWLKERRKSIGGSDVSALLGMSKYDGPVHVWATKTGRELDRESTSAMRAGTAFEPVFRRLFTEDTGIPIRRAGLYRSRTRPWMHATVDGLTGDGGIYESKNTGHYMRHEWADGQAPVHALLQTQHNLAVMGRSHAWITGMIGGNDWRIKGPIPRDEALIAHLLDTEQDFWQRYVIPDEAPPASWQDLDEVKALHYSGDGTEVTASLELEDAARALRAAKAATDEAKETEDAAEARLRQLMGDATAALDTDGKPIATLKPTGTFAARRFTAAHPELAATLATTKPTLDVERIKKDYPDLYTAARSRVLRLSASWKD